MTVEINTASQYYVNESATSSINRAIANASVLSAFDATDPESLFAFFQLQMKDARTKLTAMMTEQDARNKRCTQLQQLQATLTKYQETGVKPGDAGWAEFEQAAKDAVALLGDSKEAQTIQGMLDKAVAPTPFTRITSDRAEAKKLAKEYGTTFEVNDNAGYVTYTVTTLEGPGAGLGKNEVTSLIASLKAHTDGLQTESSMQMIRVQQLVESCSQIVNVCSNTMRKMHDMAMVAINNMRG